MNILSYSIYLSASIPLVVFCGNYCHKHGYYFISALISDEKIALAINRLLLLLYILLNVSYVVGSILIWDTIATYETAVLYAVQRIGVIMLILSVLHFNNLFCIHLFSKRMEKNKSNLKSSIS